MIGSQGINDLSRAAGDESLQHLQRVNKDGHEEKDKGGRGRGGKESDSEKGQASDSYERTAENISATSPTPAENVSPPAAETPEKSDSDIKSRKKPGPVGGRTPDNDTSHIDLVG